MPLWKVPLWISCRHLQVLKGRSKVSPQPSLLQAEQPQLSQPVLTGSEVCQTSDHFCGLLWTRSNRSITNTDSARSDYLSETAAVVCTVVYFWRAIIGNWGHQTSPFSSNCTEVFTGHLHSTARCGRKRELKKWDRRKIRVCGQAWQQCNGLYMIISSIFFLCGCFTSTCQRHAVIQTLVRDFTLPKKVLEKWSCGMDSYVN